ncbi:MAG: hypothetical protein ABFS46_02175 [Myxococcota bacterium]
MRWQLAICWLVLLLAPPEARARDRGADGRYDERRSSHFVLLQDVDIERRSGWRGSRQFEQQVLRVLEAAHEDLGDRLGFDVRRPVRVVLHDPAVFDQRFSRLFRFPAGGFYGGSIQVRGDARLTWVLERTLRHELVHAGFDQASPSWAPPAWINEGTAEWFEQRSLGKRRPSPVEIAQLREAARHGRLPTLAELSVRGFGHLPPEKAQLAYLESYAAVEQLVSRRGEARFSSFLADLVRLRNPDQALRRNYRMDTAGLEASLRNELR